jgi:hypothetical protein
MAELDYNNGHCEERWMKQFLRHIIDHGKNSQPVLCILHNDEDTITSLRRNTNIIALMSLDVHVSYFTSY